MLIPAFPRIAASFASSPGRSGTSMSIWIMAPREGHGSARLEALRAVAWRQIAYGMPSSCRSDSHALHPRLRRDPGPRHGAFRFVLPRCLGDAGRPASARPGNRRRMGGASQHRVEADARAELVPGRLQVLAGPYRTGELDHIAFECEDVERAYGELLEKGARAGHAPFAEGNSWLAYVEDPDGIWIELTGPFLANQPQARPTRRGPREARGRSGHRPRGSPCLP